MYGINGNISKFAKWIEKYKPSAIAELKGSPAYPDINGSVFFYNTPFGVIVSAEVMGLPYERENCRENIFAFHIHDGKSCTGNETDPFADSGKHYNPSRCQHPHHAGDLPPLFGNKGYAWNAVLTDRFQVEDIIGSTVIVHRMPDDFKTQPSGNSGEKIACGVIR